MEYKDYYQILGVDRKASQDEIKRVYRKLARTCHPDTCKDDPQAEARFKEINEAYEVLGDADKRGRYDALGNNWHAGDSFTPPPGFEHIFGGAPFGGRSSRGGRSDSGFSFEFGPGMGSSAGGFSDFFETIFGGGDFGMGGEGMRRSAARGSDVESEIKISLHEAHHGTTREIALQGQRGVRRLNVKIPAGAADGMKIRLAAQGNQGPGGAGDLFLRVRLVVDGAYQLEGNDVVMEYPIMPWDAALGTSVEVQTLDGPVKIKIPAGVSSGQRLRLRGKGLAHKGDFFAQMKIVLPKKLGDEEKRLFEQLKAMAGTKG